MQATPALPWAPSDGGIITLRDPITRSELLDGALRITIDGGASGTFIASIVDEAGSNAVQVGGDTLWYISPFTGSATELELVSAETGVVGYDITSIERTTPYGRTTPALPWAGVVGTTGVIELREPLTPAQIVNDAALQLGYEYHDEIQYASASWYAPDNKVIWNFDNGDVWTSDLPDPAGHDGNVPVSRINLTLATASSGYGIIDVRVN